MSKLKNVSKGLRTLDYAVAAATVVYGVYAQDPLLGSLGFVGLVLAKLNLSERISGRISRFLTRKRSAPVEVAEEAEASPPVQVISVDYGAASRLHVNGKVTYSSRHSRLAVAKHLNHALDNKTH